MLRLFAFFHLNLAYSAIEEADRPRLLKQSYWPLVELARSRDLKIAFEISAWTLETIRDLDPDLLTAIRELCTDGSCTFVGCGYTQMIGPLVPAEVNAANQRLGMRAYEDLLGFRPEIALVNEQAYAAGMLAHYRDTGYKAIIMEWDNPSRTHPDWPREVQYQPVHALDGDGESFPLIWNHSIAFQKFQRYAHGELALDDYMAYLRKHVDMNQRRVFSLYGNDIEVFDFRPGRYMTEAPLHGDGEWARIGKLFDAIAADTEMRVVSLPDVLESLPEADDDTVFRLETAGQPIPVKKQTKYNVVRWAVSGRNDLDINTRCWRLYAALAARDGSDTDADWRELCYLWSSDFRTHITEKRWAEYLPRLAAMEKSLDLAPGSSPAPAIVTAKGSDAFYTANEGNCVTLWNERLTVSFNTLRGLAIDRFIDRERGDVSAMGTLHHGYFDDIQWGADFFSGHLVYARPGARQITDLMAVTPRIWDADGLTHVACEMTLEIGALRKTWTIDPARGTLRAHYRLDWADKVERGSLRLGHVTLNPAFFDARSLFAAAHSGGRDADVFPLGGEPVNHGQSVSLLITAGHALGLTEGSAKIGDARRHIAIEVDKSLSALIGLLVHQPTSGTFFTRLELSAQEIDDTFKDRDTAGRVFEAAVTYAIADSVQG